MKPNIPLYWNIPYIISSNELISEITFSTVYHISNSIIPYANHNNIPINRSIINDHEKFCIDLFFQGVYAIGILYIRPIIFATIPITFSVISLSESIKIEILTICNFLYKFIFIFVFTMIPTPHLNIFIGVPEDNQLIKLVRSKISTIVCLDKCVLVEHINGFSYITFESFKEKYSPNTYYILIGPEYKNSIVQYCLYFSKLKYNFDFNVLLGCFSKHITDDGILYNIFNIPLPESLIAKQMEYTVKEHTVKKEEPVPVPTNIEDDSGVRAAIPQKVMRLLDDENGEQTLTNTQTTRINDWCSRVGLDNFERITYLVQQKYTDEEIAFMFS